MYYGPFYQIFPKIAEKETRILHIKSNEDVPIGEYAFFPSYCTDKTCDCRRAIIHVMQGHPNHEEFHAATISYGWEDMDFYRNWADSLSEDMLKIFKGPELDRGQPQSKYASYFLDFFKNVMLKDEKYVNRIKRHYAYFKHKKKMKLPKELKNLIDFNEACPCQSGKSFKMCCGRMRGVRRR